MKARHWYAELYVAFAEDVTEAIAEDHIEQALLQCGDVGECEVVAIEEWVDDGEDGGGENRREDAGAAFCVGA